jgi:hypothetical protein
MSACASVSYRPVKSRPDPVDEWHGAFTPFGWRNDKGDVGDMAEDITLEREVQYKSLAGGQLTQALLSLWAAERLCAECAANKDGLSALIRDAIVLYGSTFTRSDVDNRHARRLSQESYIPKHFEGLHRNLVAYRDKLFAHLDSDSRNHGRAVNEGNLSWLRNAKAALDFQDEIPNIKALILEIVCQKLWPEILDEHQELLNKSGL